MSKRRPKHQAKSDLSHIDAHLLRMVGLNPDDFRDAAEGRRRSLLCTPFRHPDRH